MYCSKCGEEIDDDAVVCPHCGVPTANYKKERSASNGTAAVMTAIIPGLGQIYKGRILTGIACMVIMLALIISVVGIPFIIIWWLICVVDAYYY